MAAALVTQHVFDMQPCPWCVLQRLIFVGIALVALLGPGLAPRASVQMRSALLMLALGLCGVAAALWQHFVAAVSRLVQADAGRPHHQRPAAWTRCCPRSSRPAPAAPMRP